MMKTPTLTNADCPHKLRQELQHFQMMCNVFQEGLEGLTVETHYDIWNSMARMPVFRCNMSLIYDDRCSIADFVFKPELKYTEFLDLLEKGFFKLKERERQWRNENYPP